MENNKEQTLQKNRFLFKWYELLILVLAVTLLIIIKFIFNTSILSLLATSIGLVASAFNIKKSYYTYFLYIASAVFYGIVSFQNKVYGEALINTVFLIPMYIYSLYSLFSKKKTSDEIKKLTKKNTIIILLIITFITIGYGFILKALGSFMPFLNSLANAVTIFCIILASRRYRAQWIFWLIYTVLIILIWSLHLSVNNEGIPYIVQNIVFLFLNTYGLITWYKKPKIN